MIEIERVSFSYTDDGETLSDISLSVGKGQCVLLCGGSGSGKTTVTKLINGLIPHFTEGGRLDGRVTAAGQVVADTELYRLAKSVGSVFQNPKSQFFNLDTDSELAFGLENEGAPPQEIERELERTVRQLHIENLLGRNIFSLSGGEKQMLAFASVYAMDPAVFVLDEPTANLDGASVERLRQQIQFLKEQGHTVVIAEHRLYFLADLIDRACYFRQGRLERIFSGAEFRALSQEGRAELGLRSLTPSPLDLPPAREEGDLQVEGLTCGYGRAEPVLSELSFGASRGEVLAVTGCNGRGKTTLTRCLCGLMKERGGRIRLFGRECGQKRRRKESFLVMQDVNHQLFYDSVFHECRQAAGERSPEIDSVLARFDLQGYRERHPMALSGGQKQRLAVATALLSGRRLLIFDEPTSGLDYGNMMQVSGVVRDLAAQGHIVLVVSHDREFMRAACDRVLNLDEAERKQTR